MSRYTNLDDQMPLDGPEWLKAAKVAHPGSDALRSAIIAEINRLSEIIDEDEAGIATGLDFAESEEDTIRNRRHAITVRDYLRNELMQMDKAQRPAHLKIVKPTDAPVSAAAPADYTNKERMTYGEWVENHDAGIFAYKHDKTVEDRINDPECTAGYHYVIAIPRSDGTLLVLEFNDLDVSDEFVTADVFEEVETGDEEGTVGFRLC